MEEPRVPTTPPHSLEAEKSILGSMLLSHTAVEQAMDTLCASDFYLARHQDIFQAIKGIYNRGKSIDSIPDQYIATVKPMYEQYVSKYIKDADFAVMRGRHNSTAIDAISAYISAKLLAERFEKEN